MRSKYLLRHPHITTISQFNNHRAYQYIGWRKKITTEEINNYKTDAASLASWLDVTIVKRKGRCFDASKSLIPIQEADTFPSITVTTLEGKDLSIPAEINGDVKLIVFSFKHYGFSLVRSWIDPFLNHFQLVENNTKKENELHHHHHEPAALVFDFNSEVSPTKNDIVDVDHQLHMNTTSMKHQSTHKNMKKSLRNNDSIVAFELCMIEYSFLSIAKSVFIQNMITAVQNPYQIPRTGLAFGGVKNFAAQLLLPNVYTGYAYLLDHENRIRWKGSGQANDEELKVLYDCTEQLLNEKQ